MRKTLARLGTAVLAASMLTLGTAGLALADGTPFSPYTVGGVSQENTSNTALINPDATVQLDIHKYLGTLSTTVPNNGSEQSVTGLPALSGVDFDVYKVYYDADHTQPVDLTTNQGWTDASAVYGYTPTATDFSNGYFTIGTTTYYIGLVRTATTDGTGTAVFTEANGVGLYLVNENLATSGTITNLTTNEEVMASSITPAKPFFVTLPMTNPVDTTRWMYDVNVYPKNQSDTITKTVKDEETYSTGETISYSLESSIPTGSLGYYYVGDSNAYIDATAVTVSVGGTALTGCDATAGTQTGCDYFYWLDYDTTADGSQVKVVFTTAGLAALEAAKTDSASAMVTTTIEGTVTSVPDTGIVLNMGEFIPSNNWWIANGGDEMTPPTDTPTTPPDTTDTPGIPSNEVKSYFGNVTVDKTLVGGSSTDSAVGAAFALYIDPTPDTACTAEDVSGDPYKEATITEGSSVTFSPLRASDWADNAEVAQGETGYQQYCVVETKAPTGYNLNAEPFTAVINWESGATTINRTATVAVNDEKSNLGNSLPMTGGAGVAGVSLLALALVGGGIGYYVVTRRREDEQDA